MTLIAASMAAMMLPTAAPFFVAYGHSSRRFRSTAIVMAIYAAVWATIGLVANLVMSQVMLTPGLWLVAGAALFPALYALAPWSRRSRASCREMCRGPAGDPVRSGLTYAANCVMCSAGVMVAVVMLGPDGLQRYRDVLSLASQWEPTRRYAIAGPLGLGPHLYAVEAVVVAVAVAAAWRQRGLGTSRPIATGIVASLLFTPYVGFQDFAILVVAGWLLVRSGATWVQVALMVIGYALLELALLVLAVPILLAEAALLLSLAWPSSFRSAGAGEALENSAQRSVGVRRV